MVINGVQPNNQEVSVQTQPTEVSKSKLETSIVIADNPCEQDIESTLDDEQLEKKLNEALKYANGKMQQNQARTRCEFTYFENVNRVSIKLIDKETNEVVKEIPPEKTIIMIEKLWEVAGLMIDERL